MEYGYKITPGPEYVHAEAWGEDNKTRPIEFFKATIQACLDAHQPRVLLESRAENPLSTLEYYQVGQEILRMGLPAGHKIAAVTYQPGVRLGDRFLETLARNRGIRGRLFATRDEALQWLLQP